MVGWRSAALIAALGLVAAAGQAQAKAPKLMIPEIEVVLTGQSLLQSDIRLAGERFRATAPLLSGDVVFTNFETTVREPGASLAAMDPSAGVHAPPEALDALKDLGFNLISAANNHVYDIGEVGLLATRKGLQQRRLAFSGIGLDLAEATAPAYLRTHHGVVALVSMATGFLQPHARATATEPGLNELALAGGAVSALGGPVPADAERNLAAIRAARRKAGLVIVYQHNHVYDRPFVDLMRERSPDRLRPPAWVKVWAHREIDAGADLVVMHGAPFLQGVEIYQGKPIFYDLGNYIFQLPPQHSDLFGPLANESAIAAVRFRGRRLRAIVFHPIVLEPRPAGTGAAVEAARGLPAPAAPPQAETILQRLVTLSQELGTHLRVENGMAELVLPAGH